MIAIQGLRMAFGHLPLLDDASVLVEAGERVAIIGRNGSGKSTLMRILAGELEPDAGTIWRAPDLVAARLGQDVTLADERSVFDVVADGLGGLGDLVAAYHRAALAVADRGDAPALAALGRLQHDLEERHGWTLEQRVERVLSKLSLPADATVDDALRRLAASRAAGARAGRRVRRCCCSTSRRIISTSTRSRGSRRSCATTRAPSSS